MNDRAITIDSAVANPEISRGRWLFSKIAQIFSNYLTSLCWHKPSDLIVRKQVS